MTNFSHYNFISLTKFIMIIASNFQRSKKKNESKNSKLTAELLGLQCDFNQVIESQTSSLSPSIKKIGLESESPKKRLEFES